MLAIFVKWVPLLFLALHALAARATGRRPRSARSRTRSSSRPSRRLRYGLDWLPVFAARRQRALETSYALPHRLEQLGLPTRSPSGRRRRAARGGLAWLAARGLRGRARLGLAACLVLSHDAVPRGLVPGLDRPARRRVEEDRTATVLVPRALRLPAAADDPALSRAAEDDDAVLGADDVPARVPARAPRAARDGRGRGVVEVARLRRVDGDPVGPPGPGS